MSPKIAFKVLTILCLTVMFAGFVSGYQIDIDVPYEEDANITSIRGDHFIKKNGDLESNINVRIYLPSNYSAKHHNITIRFFPWEHTTMKPVENVSVANEGKIPCKRYFKNYTEPKPFRNEEGKRELLNYTKYYITFVPEKTESWRFFEFEINYTTPKFIFEQGDYYVAWLNFPNMEGKSMENTIALHSEEDIPRFLPDAKRIMRPSVDEYEKNQSRWAFLFEGTEDIMIWYWNEERVKEREQKLRRDYTIFGAILGFIGSFIVAMLVIFLERKDIIRF